MSNKDNNNPNDLNNNLVQLKEHLSTDECSKKGANNLSAWLLDLDFSEPLLDEDGSPRKFVSMIKDRRDAGVLDVIYCLSGVILDEYTFGHLPLRAQFGDESQIVMPGKTVTVRDSFVSYELPVEFSIRCFDVRFSYPYAPNFISPEPREERVQYWYVYKVGNDDLPCVIDRNML
jgi:hypothetical protein